jgi:hypothetical protein
MVWAPAKDECERGQRAGLHRFFRTILYTLAETTTKRNSFWIYILLDTGDEWGGLLAVGQTGAILV